MYRLDLVCFETPFRFSLRTMRSFASQPNAFTIVAECEGTLIGFVIVEIAFEYGLSAGYVVTLDVHPEHRREGVAAGLIEQAERRSAESGATRMWLHVYAGNQGARRFYESAGFQQVGRTADFYGNGIGALIFAKSVPARS